jgi:hypothetical protein
MNCPIFEDKTRIPGSRCVNIMHLLPAKHTRSYFCAAASRIAFRRPRQAPAYEWRQAPKSP